MKTLCDCHCGSVCPFGKLGSEPRCEMDLMPEPLVWGQTYDQVMFIGGHRIACKTVTAFFVEGKLTWLLTNQNSVALV